MRLFINYCEVEVLDIEDKIIAVLRFDSLSNQTKEKYLSPIHILSAQEADTLGESQYQLLENCEYRCRILLPDKSIAYNWKIRENKLIKQSKVFDDSDHFIQTKNSAGTLFLIIEDHYENFVGKASVEIRSLKLDYRKEYKGMVCGIANHARELLSDLGAPTEIPFQNEASENLPTLVQQIEFLQSIFYATNFWRSVNRIMNLPSESLYSFTESSSSSRIRRIDHSISLQIKKGNHRANISQNHPLSSIIPTIPRNLDIIVKNLSRDTPENRFVKYILNDFHNFTLKTLSIIESLASRSERSKYDNLAKDCRLLSKKLSERLSCSFFRYLPKPQLFPTTSPIMQRKSGYREVFQTWLGFRSASRLRWEGSSEIFGFEKNSFYSGQKDLPTLYESWLFFVLLNLFKNKFQVDENVFRDFFNSRGQFGEFTLRRGFCCSFPGFSLHGFKLRGLFQYNRTFYFSDDSDLSSSWTRALRPDFTMSFWPQSIDLPEAESNRSVVHLHFDAKYRVQNVSDLFGDDDGTTEPNSSKDIETDGNYNRSDLLKMHAYRDAIRRSEGAYVIYPGIITSVDRNDLSKKENRRWSGFHELLPGLGAFAIRPSTDGNALGVEHLNNFLDGVLDQLANRSSRLSHTRFNDFREETAATLPPLERAAVLGTNRIIERVMDNSTLNIPSQEIIVLGGAFSNSYHLHWIYKSGLIDFSFDNLNPSQYLLRLIPDLARAKFIILLNQSAVPHNCLFQITNDFFECTNDYLLNLDHPCVKSFRYIVFPVTPLQIFADYHWSHRKLSTFVTALNDKPWSKLPFQLTLSQLMYSRNIPT